MIWREIQIDPTAGKAETHFGPAAVGKVLSYYLPCVLSSSETESVARGGGGGGGYRVVAPGKMPEWLCAQAAAERQQSAGTRACRLHLRWEFERSNAASANGSYDTSEKES